MSSRLRRVPVKFTDTNGGNAFVFPPYAREWASEQPYAAPAVPVVGADYGFDPYGAAVSPRGVATDRVRFLLAQRFDVAPDHPHYVHLDTQLDEMFARVHANARGRLWIEVSTPDGVTQRFAEARVADRPTTVYGGKSGQTVPVTMRFVRLSDWYHEDATVIDEHVSSSPATIEVDNIGTARARNVTIEVWSLGTNGYVSPTITNTTTGESFQILHTGANANHVFRIHAGEFRIERSTDGGTTWIDAYANVSIGATQGTVTSLAPGLNFLTVSQASGTPNFRVVVRFHPPYV